MSITKLLEKKGDIGNNHLTDNGDTSDLNDFEKRLFSNLHSEEEGSSRGTSTKTSGDPSSVLSQLSNISVGNSTSNSNAKITNFGHSHSQTTERKKGQVKKGLIEELPLTTLPTPKHWLQSSETESGYALVLTVKLPGVKSVSECVLDITEVSNSSDRD